MATQGVTRTILSDSQAFKQFWQENGPFKYALTSSEYPPILLQEEEWLFSNDLVALLKELMQYSRQKMKMVKAPFRAENKNVLRPDDLSEWKMTNFPEEWNMAHTHIFVPEGHVTRKVLKEIPDTGSPVDAAMVEQAFFACLARDIGQLGYVLFKPVKGAKRASVQSYVKEWEEDEKDAGLL